MFKSKPFTIAFVLLLLLNLILCGIFFYLVLGKGTDRFAGLFRPSQSASLEPTAPVAATGVLTRITQNDDHTYPVLNELISEKGRLTLRANGSTSGVVFHKLPAFDGRDAEGNIVQFAGTYDTVGKVYVDDGEMPYLMYKTESGYYVTSNPQYVTYQTSETVFTPDSYKVKTYSGGTDAPFSLTLHQEDGNHVAFSLYYISSGEKTALLTYMIGTYKETGSAVFEYKDGELLSQGTLTFSGNEEGGNLSVTVSFAYPITRDEKTFKEFTLR